MLGDDVAVGSADGCKVVERILPPSTSINGGTTGGGSGITGLGVLGVFVLGELVDKIEG